ncbi:hypothetical protein LTS18_006171 [Coniosporium uncinatum]|uniref:Uncharacterized protein n=1 Tax=Coniosporium uncinatum TaxID=93489 RepID=A0ACC3DD53_9PEZI|nr:hypothetical protein LTS18_006171 [Coniosporium uncinatum]
MTRRTEDSAPSNDQLSELNDLNRAQHSINPSASLDQPPTRVTGRFLNVVRKAMGAEATKRVSQGFRRRLKRRLERGDEAKPTAEDRSDDLLDDSPMSIINRPEPKTLKQRLESIRKRDYLNTVRKAQYAKLTAELDVLKTRAEDLQSTNMEEASELRARISNIETERQQLAVLEQGQGFNAALRGETPEKEDLAVKQLDSGKTLEAENAGADAKLQGDIAALDQRVSDIEKEARLAYTKRQKQAKDRIRLHASRQQAELRPAPEHESSAADEASTPTIHYHGTRKARTWRPVSKESGGPVPRLISYHRLRHSRKFSTSARRLVDEPSDKASDDANGYVSRINDRSTIRHPPSLPGTHSSSASQSSPRPDAAETTPKVNRTKSDDEDAKVSRGPSGRRRMRASDLGHKRLKLVTPLGEQRLQETGHILAREPPRDDSGAMASTSPVMDVQRHPADWSAQSPTRLQPKQPGQLSAWGSLESRAPRNLTDHAAQSSQAPPPSEENLSMYAMNSASQPTQARLTHVTESGSAHMVSVGNKPATHRTAIAVGTVAFSNPDPYRLIKSNSIKKGDVLSVARVAGIMAAKNCPALIPLCHPVALTSVDVELKLFGSDTIGNKGYGAVAIEAKVECIGPTGVEMEALTAVMGSALTVVDMCKAVDKGMDISSVRVVLKEGGRSGSWGEEGWTSLKSHGTGTGYTAIEMPTSAPAASENDERTLRQVNAQIYLDYQEHRKQRLSANDKELKSKILLDLKHEQLNRLAELKIKYNVDGLAKLIELPNSIALPDVLKVLPTRGENDRIWKTLSPDQQLQVDKLELAHGVPRSAVLKWLPPDMDENGVDNELLWLRIQANDLKRAAVDRELDNIIADVERTSQNLFHSTNSSMTEVRGLREELGKTRFTHGRSASPMSTQQSPGKQLQEAQEQRSPGSGTTPTDMEVSTSHKLMLQQKRGANRLLSELRQEVDIKRKEVLRKGKQADAMARLADEHILRIHHLMVEHGRDVRETLVARRPGIVEVDQLVEKLVSERKSSGRQPFMGSTLDTKGLAQKFRRLERMHGLSKQTIKDMIPNMTDMREAEEAIDRVKSQVKAVVHNAVHRELDALCTELGVPIAMPPAAAMTPVEEPKEEEWEHDKQSNEDDHSQPRSLRPSERIAQAVGKHYPSYFLKRDMERRNYRLKRLHDGLPESSFEIHCSDAHMKRLWHLLITYHIGARVILAGKKPGIAEVQRLIDDLTQQRQTAGIQASSMADSAPDSDAAKQVEILANMYRVPSEKMFNMLPKDGFFNALHDFRRQARAIMEDAIDNELDNIEAEAEAAAASPAPTGSAPSALEDDFEDADRPETPRNIRCYTSSEQEKDVSHQDTSARSARNEPANKQQQQSLGPKQFDTQAAPYRLPTSIGEMDDLKWKHMCNEARKILSREPEKIGFAQRIRLNMVLADAGRRWRDIDAEERETAFGEIKGLLRPSGSR